MGKDEMVRFMISLPDWYHRKLELWAALKGSNRATLAANIIQARIEANWETVERDIRAIAEHNGVTIEELERQWLGDDKQKSSASDDEG